MLAWNDRGRDIEWRSAINTAWRIEPYQPSNPAAGALAPPPETAEEQMARYYREAMAELDIIAPEGVLGPEREPWWPRWRDRGAGVLVLLFTLGLIIGVLFL